MDLQETASLTTTPQELPLHQKQRRTDNINNPPTLFSDHGQHLVDAVGELVSVLLDACPHLRILATSRQALGAVGEVIWTVSLLSVPDLRSAPMVAHLEGYESVRLFLDRARQGKPAFALSPQNAQAVAQICAYLEGLPLAIELAAARIKMLPPMALLSRLSDRLKLLSGGPREFSERQRTLRSTIECSYEMLEEGEKAFFARFSVFSGGATLVATEKVCDALGDLSVDVLDGVSSLFDKSVLGQEEAAGGEPRLVMLETIREYARERLQESGEAEEINRVHAQYFLTLAEEAEAELKGSNQLEWLERLEAEHDNLRAGLSWALDPEGARQPEVRAELGLRLTATLGQFWESHSHINEGRWWLERGLAESGAVSTARAKALNWDGRMAIFQGDEQTIALLEESLAVFRKLGDKPGIATSLSNLGLAVVFLQIDKWRLGTLREEAEALLRDPPNRRVATHLLHFRVMTALDEGDYERAAALTEKSVALNRELENIQGIAVELLGLGTIASKRGNHDRAVAAFQEGLNLWQKLRDVEGIAFCLLGLAVVAAQRGEPVRAARLWGATEALEEGIGSVHDLPFVHSQYDYESLPTTVRARLGEAVFERAREEGKGMTPEEAVEYALSGKEPASPAAPVPEKPPAGAQPYVLTRREREVTALVARGLSNRQIAQELHLSQRTVGHHVSKILRKLDLASRSQIAAWATEQQLLAPEPD